MTPRPDAEQALDTYVESLVAIGGQLTSILQHMYAHHAPGDDKEPNRILTGLLRDILEEPAAACADSDLLAASEIVELTSKTITSELFLVSDELMEEWRRKAEGESGPLADAARNDRRARRKLSMRPRRPL